MLPFLQLLVIVGAVGGTLFLLWRPYWVFVLIMCMWPVEQLITAYIPAMHQRSRFINYTIGGLAAVGVLSRLLKRDPVLQAYKNPVTILTGILYALWLLGIIWTPQVAKDYVLESLFMSVSYQGLLLVLLPLLIVDTVEFRRMLPGVMMLGSVVAVLIMLNPNSSFYAGRLQLDLGMVGGGIHRHGNPLAIGEMGGMIALMAVLVKPQYATLPYTLLRIAAFVIGMGLAIGSGSRGQVLAAGLCGVAFFPLARRLASPKHFIISVFGFGVIVVGMYVVFKVFIGQQNEQRWEVFGMLRDTTLRLTYVWELLAEFMANPQMWLFGLGTNAYVAISPDTDLTYVHNVAAEALCEHGFIGGIIFVALAWMTLQNGRQLFRIHQHDDSLRSVVAIILAMCTYTLLLSLKQGSMSYPAPFFWWMILAKLTTHERTEAALWTEPVNLHDEDLLGRSPEEAYADERGYALG